MNASAPLSQTDEPVRPEATLDATVELILARVRLLARRRGAWLRHLATQSADTRIIDEVITPPRLSEQSDESQQRIPHEGLTGETGASYEAIRSLVDETNLVHRVFGTRTGLDILLGDLDNPADEADWQATDEDAIVWGHELVEIAAVLTHSHSQLTMLRQIFGLSEPETDLLQACVAVAVEPAFGHVFAQLQGDERRGYVTEHLVARLCGYGRTLPWSAASPLRRWELVTEHEVAPDEPPLFVCDRSVRDWLVGRPDIDPALVDIASLRQPLPPLAGWPVAETAAAIERALAVGQGGVRVVVIGPAGGGRRTLAAAVAAELGLSLLAIDIDQSERDDHDWRRVVLRANRYAFLHGRALAWHGDTIGQRSWPQIQPPFPIQFVVADGEPPAAWPGFVDHVVDVPLPSAAERRALWQGALPAAERWSAGTLDQLAARHRTPVGGIVTIARQGVAGPDEALAAVRAAGRGRLGPLAQLLDCPFQPDDLVVNDDLRAALDDIVFEAQERLVFWERPEARRLFPEGRGLLALFTGPPGTGKTMAAQVIAATLGLDLYRVDVSAVVSKYVGETSQNMERILTRARHLDAVLLFDEADALFARRTEIKDAHDRFANTDTNYLLQAVERYPGVVLLSSNKKANIDPAFFRRLRYVLDFPRPDVAQREVIWTRIVGELAGWPLVDTLNGQLSALAAGVETTGAQIKFATLASLFIARRAGAPLAVSHLVRGLERELAKDGRALSARERERLTGGTH